MKNTRGFWIAIGGSVLAAIFALTAPGELGGYAIVIWSLGCTGVIFTSLPKVKDDNRTTILILGWTALLVAVGFIVRGIHGELVGQAAPIPSPADLIHIPGYLLFFTTVLRVHRARSGGVSINAWLDAVMISTSLFIVLWSTFLGDFVFNSDIDFSTRFVNSIYTTIILATFTLFLRVSATPGTRPVAYYLLGSAAFSYFVVDLAATYSLVRGEGLSLTIALSPFVYGLCVAAVRHESCERLLDKQEETEFRVGPLRLAIIGFAILSPMAVSLLEPRRGTVWTSVLVIASLVLTLVVVVRVLRLLTMQERSARLERSLAEEISHLASLSSAEEILNHLPAACDRVIPEFGTPTYVGEELEEHGFVLPQNLRRTNRTSMVFANSIIPERERRVIQSLIRDAGLINASAEGVAASAKRESEAEANRRIAANERRFRALVQNASDVVLVMDRAGIVSYVSEAAENVIGYPAPSFLGKTLEWIHHENDWEFAQDYLRAFLNGTSSGYGHEIRAIHSDGSIRLLDCVMTDMQNVEGVEGIVINVTDSTDKRLLESNLRDAETIDPLTMQLNRTAFIREVDAAIRRSSVSETSVALAIINIDDFRLINEGYGTTVADEVLVELAFRVRQAVRIDDSVARLNGDEFGILMPAGYSVFEAEGALERILQGLTEPVSVSGRAIALRATAGLVLNSDGSTTGLRMLRDADTALDTAKQTARGSFVLFDEAMGEEVSERVELRNLLHDAIATNKLRLAFQPIVDMESGEIVSMEALSRWHDSTRGNISPATFIPIAEATGMISELGEWALRTACQNVVKWAALGHDGFTVSVNMSGHQLREESVIATVQGVLEETQVDPTRITIEITESVLIDDTDFIAHRIAALRDLGVKLAIDDFGTGYSSLSYLRRYDFDVLKVDRSFVIPLADDANQREREIVNAMIKLAQALGAVTVAEGIEEPEEYAVLRTLGCDHAQGYLFWYPLEAEDVIEALASDPSKSIAA